jgi:signal transduction histidine kinase
VFEPARRAWRWHAAHPTWADVALAVALLGLAVVSSRVAVSVSRWADPSFSGPSTLAELLGLVVSIAPLGARRRLPLTVALVCTVGWVCSRVWLDAVEPTVTAIALSVALFSAAAYGPPRWRHAVCGACLAAIMGELYRELAIRTSGGTPPNLELFEFFTLLFYLALACAMWALGSTIGAGRRRARMLVQRTVALEEQREENARRAVFDERVRIARELHDVVAHHVSVMGVQAGAARMIMNQDPDRAAAALASIEASSRQAVEELHRLLGFLRQSGDADDLTPRPGLDQLTDLAASMATSGLAVTVAREGDRRPLPPTVDVSAYRIVQEALTNTLKHAHGAHATVCVRYLPTAIQIDVLDDGRAVRHAVGERGGLGLIGMRERAVLHGGTLVAHPSDDGGFTVQATLPTSNGAR